MTQKPLAYLARNPQTIIQRNIVPGSRMFNDVGFPQVRELLRTAIVDQGISLSPEWAWVVLIWSPKNGRHEVC